MIKTSALSWLKTIIVFTISLLDTKITKETSTAWKVSKYGFFSGPHFPVFGLNTGKYRPEKTLYLDIFQAVQLKSGGLKNKHNILLYMSLPNLS